MPLETRLEQQIAINAAVLGEGAGQPAPAVYHVIDTNTAAAEFLGMSEDEMEAFLAGVVCRSWDECEIEGD